MRVGVYLATALRAWSGGRDVVAVEVDEGASIGAVLAALFALCPGVQDRVLDETGAVRRHVNVFVGEERALTLAVPVPAGVEVAILPAVSGG
jgi:molybdopterin converting factor small subunit